MILDLEWLLGFVLVITRFLAMIFLIPIFGRPLIPTRAQMGLAGFFALIVVPMIPLPDLASWYTGEILLMISKEAFVGLMMGFAGRMVFFIAEFAGQIMAHESGLAMSAGFDPVSGLTGTTISRILFVFTAVMVFTTGLHHEILSAFIVSYEVVPMGLELPGLAGLREIVRATSHVFVIGVQIAAPFIAMNFIINLIFSVMGKAVPKMNVFMVSFGVRIMVSLWLLTAAYELVAQYLYREAEATPMLMLRFLAN